MNIYKKYTSNLDSLKNNSLEPELWNLLNLLNNSPLTIIELADKINLDLVNTSTFINHLLENNLCFPVKNTIKFDQWKKSQPELQEVELKTTTSKKSAYPPKEKSNTPSLISIEVSSKDTDASQATKILQMPQTLKPQKVAFEIN